MINFEIVCYLRSKACKFETKIMGLPVHSSKSGTEFLTVCLWKSGRSKFTTLITSQVMLVWCFGYNNGYLLSVSVSRIKLDFPIYFIPFVPYEML